MPNCISDKMFALTQKNSAVREMFEEGNRLAKLYGRENVYDFSLGNPNFPAPARVKDAVIDVLNTEPTTMVHGYMSNAGYPDTRKAIAESLNKRFGTAFSEANILMSVGAAGGLNVILKTLLNPGDEVLAFAPFFLEYGNYVRNYDGELKIVPPNLPSFQPDPAALEAAVTAKTKAVIINSPNNPTGVIYSEDTLRALGAVLEKKASEYGHPIFILADEPYRELAYDGAVVPWITKLYRNTVVCYSWSKSLSLPGERIGYLVIPSEIDDYTLVFDAASIATRVLGFVNAPSLMQRAVMRCLDEETDINGYDSNRKKLCDGLRAAGYECAEPQGAFYLWVKTPCDDREFAQTAKKHNILVVPGTSFACPGYVRIAYCVSAHTIEGALPGFKKLAEEYGLK